MAKDIVNKVGDYYTEKIKLSGANSNGVDWNSKESHLLRFKQLSKVIDLKSNFSILDYGCGYGELINFLNNNKFQKFNYFGYDISNKMIEEANKKHKSKNIHFSFKEEFLKGKEFDFCIANGIFNVKLNFDEEKWKEYIISTLNEMNKLSLKGFSFNILTSYSDKEFMKNYLYYADPLFFFNYCKLNFSKKVSLVHDYPLYEFSIIVKK